ARIHADGQPDQRRDELLEDGEVRQALVRDDERALHALLLQVGHHLAARAGTERDGGGEGELRDGHGNSGFQGIATLASTDIGFAAAMVFACFASRTKYEPAKASELMEMSSKQSRERGTTSIHSFVTRRL